MDDDLKNLLFEENCNSSQIVQWIQGHVQLPGYESKQALRQDFVPMFLNFLNNQTARYFEKINQHGVASTPRSSRYQSPRKKEVKSTSKKLSAKSLDFSNSSFHILHKGENGSSFKQNSSANKSSMTSASEYNLDCERLSPVSEICASRTYNNTSTPKNISNTGKVNYSFVESNCTSSNDSFKKNNARKNSGINLKTANNISYNSLSNLSPSFQTSFENRFKSAKNTRRSLPLMPTNTAKKLDLKNDEEFPLIGMEQPKNIKPKRIKPTQLTTTQFLAKQEFSQMDSSPFTRDAHESFSNLSVKKSSFSSLGDECDLYIKSKEKLQQEGMSFFNNPCESFKQRAPLDDTMEIIEEPLLESVTCQSHLYHLSSLYSELILCNMVPNITTELYYLFQLITLDKTPKDNKQKSKYDVFCSYQNCLFFCVKTMSKLLDCLSLLDPVTIKLLSENSRIVKFDPDLHADLMQLADIPNATESSIIENSSIVNVSFQSETDSSRNFTSMEAFQNFRKQRDLFYEILRCWQDKHTGTNWVFEKNLGKLLDQLMNCRYSPANMMHLAKLFCMQLVKMCKANEDNDENNAGLTFVSELRHTDPARWRSLTARFVKTMGPVPPPSFRGAEEFFKSFIVTTRNYFFMRHLKDTLCARISELVNESYNLRDVNKKDAWSTLYTLRLYGKFLGFVEFMPYQTEDHIAENILATFITERNSSHPMFKFSDFLKRAATTGCLVLMVPMLVEFLSMADPVVFHTKFYLTLAFQLIYLFKTLRISVPHVPCSRCQFNIVSPSESKKKWNPMNSFYLKTILGWLFSLPHFPDGLFYARASEANIFHEEYLGFVETIERLYTYDMCHCKLDTSQNAPGNIDHEGHFETPKKKLLNLSMDLSPIKRDGDIFYHHGTTSTSTPQKAIGVKASSKLHFDCRTFIDHEMLLISCPYLKDLTIILRNAVNDVSRPNQSSSYRKITPLPSSNKSLEVAPKNIQLTLIENFFHNQPASVKKCADFVVERLSSNIVTAIRKDLLPKYKDFYLNENKKKISLVFKESRKKRNINVNELAHGACRSIIADVSKDAVQMAADLSCQSKIATFVVILMPSDMDEETLKMCYGIIQKKLHSEIVNWLNTRLTPGFCVNDLSMHLNKWVKHEERVLSHTRNDNEHTKENEDSKIEDFTQNVLAYDASIPLPSDVMAEVKEILLHLNMNPMEKTVIPDLKPCLNNIHLVTSSKQFLTLTSFKALEELTSELTSTILITSPDILSQQDISPVYEFWLNKMFTRTDELLLFMSPRLFLILAMKPQECQLIAWKNIETALTFLIIDKNLINLTQLHDACLTLLKEDWTDSILKGLGNLLSNFAKKFNISEVDASIKDIIDWMGWICSDIARLDYLL